MPNKSVTGRAVRVSSAGAPLKLEMREFPAPKPGDVRLRVQACGICHSDSLTKEGQFPGIPYPISPGHEVVGLIDALGEGVTTWSLGQRVGVGWYGGHCGVCDRCRRGDFVLCVKAMVPGLTFDGGYADYLNVPAQALAAVPDSLTSAEAGPLLCAGITTFNALRHSGATAGDLVAILGVGGLGHLAVQFANKMGFRTVAIARGQDKAGFVKSLGAHHYIDTVTQDVAKELTSLGGAKVILATLNNSDAMSAAMGGLGYDSSVILGVSSGACQSVAAAADPAPPIRHRLGERRRDRFRRHPQVLIFTRRAPHDRTLSLRENRRSLRPHDERRSKISRRSRDRRLTALRLIGQWHPVRHPIPPALDLCRCVSVSLLEVLIIGIDFRSQCASVGGMRTLSVRILTQSVSGGLQRRMRLVVVPALGAIPRQHHILASSQQRKIGDDRGRHHSVLNRRQSGIGPLELALVHSLLRRLKMSLVG